MQRLADHLIGMRPFLHQLIVDRHFPGKRMDRHASTTYESTRGTTQNPRPYRNEDFGLFI
ncbi:MULTISPECIES: hypothetical protein [unclassified Paenibacillus]|uniref:hypothetical protein n=1 Tax=unclassified Paenibacillus TaxID=185978 RepID=UPI001AE33D9C|nr:MULTISPECIES: hypothetical protein [unclassified Paenibacillus]MBP1155023.1 hypothetical protein [Paenibacillus sp. PvP091]MBP1169594.1 hypothetical protein [Paenibacillus sp. PvR098]MBP2440622.1 hypothetical protein [Paenibacillus sp. PvP052]